MSSTVRQCELPDSITPVKPWDPPWIKGITVQPPLLCCYLLNSPRSAFQSGLVQGRVLWRYRSPDSWTLVAVSWMAFKLTFLHIALAKLCGNLIVTPHLYFPPS